MGPAGGRLGRHVQAELRIESGDRRMPCRNEVFVADRQRIGSVAIGPLVLEIQDQSGGQAAGIVPISVLGPAAEGEKTAFLIERIGRQVNIARIADQVHLAAGYRFTSEGGQPCSSLLSVMRRAGGTLREGGPQAAKQI